MKDQNSNPDSERIRELLDLAAPRDRDTAGRADAVTRRARRSRTRRGVLSGAAVAAVAAAVIITPSLLTSSPTTNEATDDPDRGGVVVPSDQGAVLADPCPDGPVDVTEAWSVPGLPTGAATVRLCRAAMPTFQSEPNPTSSWNAPADGLVTDVDGFIAAVNSLPAWELPAECATMLLAPDPFALVFSYGSGETVVIGSANIACSGIEIGGLQVGADRVVTAFLRGLGLQRESLSPPAVAEPECPAPADPDAWQRLEAERDTWSPAADPLEGVTMGAICYLADPWGATVYEDTEAQLSRTQIDTIVADLRARSTIEPGREGGCTDTGPSRVLVLMNAWGDQTSWSDVSCQAEFVGVTGRWAPSAAAEAAIAAALGGAINESD